MIFWLHRIRTRRIISAIHGVCGHNPKAVWDTGGSCPRVFAVSRFYAQLPIDKAYDIMNAQIERTVLRYTWRHRMAGLRKRNPETMKEIQAFVEDYFFEYHQSPSMQKVADAIGTSKSTAYYYVMEMARNGMLHYDGKTIETPHTQKSDYKMNRAPVLGSIVCGSPELTEEDFEEFVALPVALFGEGDFFVLRTHGHSMVDAGIDEGDMVVVKKQDHANYGDIVVALVGNETTLKTYYPEPENKRIRLHPENASMEDIVVRVCNIQGVAKHVIKKL